MSQQLCPHGRKFCLFNDLSSKTNLLMSECLISFIAKSAVDFVLFRELDSIHREGMRQLYTDILCKKNNLRYQLLALQKRVLFYL